jgi:hypothetical protein
MWETLRSWLLQREERRLAQLFPEWRVVVSTNLQGISVNHPDGQHQQVSWSEATRVVIEIRNAGPGRIDWRWVVEGPEATCEFPDGSTGQKEAREAFTAHLTGFDWDAVNDAAWCSESARFVCWEKQRAG